MNLASDLLKTHTSPAKVKIKHQSTGRPPRYRNELGQAESADSIGDRHGCSYGKVMWLYKKYICHVIVFQKIKEKGRKKSNKALQSKIVLLELDKTTGETL